MLKIGVTGGIGSGKSLVCKVFETLGVPIYSTDLKTKQIQIKDLEVIEGTKKIFGEEAYDSNNQLNREFIAAKVFDDKSKLAQLNSLVHPKVFQDFENWCKALKNQPYIIKESALTFETGFNKKLDKVILVTAPIDVRINRVLERDKFRTIDEVKNIIDKQMPEAEKIKLADYILANDESDLMFPHIFKLHKAFSKSIF